MEELLRRLYAHKDERCEKHAITYHHDARLRAAVHAEWDAIESVCIALKELEKAEKNTDDIYANP